MTDTELQVVSLPTREEFADLLEQMILNDEPDASLVDAYAAVLAELEQEHQRAERYLAAIRAYVGPPNTVAAGTWLSPFGVLQAIAAESEKPA